MKLQISPNGHSLTDETGAPFFYLADTAWELLHRLSFTDADAYLRDRASKGFTTIQTVILAEVDGLRTPNANGDLPLDNLDPTRLNEAYFAHVDAVLERAHELGLVLALLPTWGDKWNHAWGVGPEVFTPHNARIYAEFLGRRYREAPNLIWVLGGDRPIDTSMQREVTEAMAAGLDAGGSTHLKTFHPRGSCGSSQLWPDAEWLDFHMWQSGHTRNQPNFERIAEDYVRTPVKPVLDGEPAYEDHKSGFALENGFLDDYDCRKSLYWALFSGACGHTYGCHPVWQFWEKGRTPINHPRRDWRAAMQLPGAAQMGHARKLHDISPFLRGVPDAGLVVAQPKNKDGEEFKPFHVAAIRAADSSFALFYFPGNSKVEINLVSLGNNPIRARWFDPRSGQIESSETLEATATHAFTAPGWGPDWILILEKA